MNNPQPGPISRPRVAALGESATLTASQIRTLEAFADTVIPGKQRYPGDVLAGRSATAGAVEAGALAVLCDPATGIEDGVAEMADLLDEHARKFAHENEGCVVQEFAQLTFEERTQLIARLTGPNEPERDLWFLLALFSTMAYDSAPHLETAHAVNVPGSGLHQMGFLPPEGDRWRFKAGSYRRDVARLHPRTLDNGSLP